MKRNIFTKAIGLLLAVCFTFGNMVSIPAYAMENSENYVETMSINDSGIVPYSGHDILYYGQVVDILDGVTGHKITITKDNLTPYKIVEDDLRMHRLIFDFGVRSSQNVKFRVTLKTQWHGDYESNWNELDANNSYTITNNPEVTHIYDEELTISHGEQVSFYFEVSPSNASVEIYRFNVYCD